MKNAVIYILLFFLLVTIPVFFLHDIVNIEDVRKAVHSFGVFSPILFIILASFTNIIPPLASVPFWIASVILFGPIEGFILSFSANLLGSYVNFVIGRIWGRPVIAKIAGKDSLREIEKMPLITNPQKLFAMKFLGGAATDYISYASGLSKIDSVSYLAVTALSSLPMMLFGFFIISRINMHSFASTASGLGIFYLINYSSTFLLIPLTLHYLKDADLKE